MKLTEKTYTVRGLCGIAFACAPGSTVGFFALSTLLAAYTPVQTLLLAQVLERADRFVADGAAGPLLLSLASLLAMLVVVYGGGALSDFFYMKLMLRIRRDYTAGLAEKRARVAYRYIENPEAWDLMSRVRKDADQKICNCLNNLTRVIFLVVSVGGTFGILFVHAWWAALAVIALSIPLVRYAYRSGKVNYEAGRQAERHIRRAHYLSTVLTGRDSASERALFGYADALGERFTESAETARKAVLRVRAKRTVRMKSGGLAMNLLSIVIVLLMLIPLRQGSMGVGLYISLVSAFITMNHSISWTLTEAFDQLAQDREYARDLTVFAGYEEDPYAELTPGEARPFGVIELRGVRFCYPGAEREILRGVTMRLEAGRHYALVGANGSGKTTLTRLLIGLYDNYEGEILVDGRELRSLAPEARKALFTSVFQDFAHYQIPLYDNIALGSIRSFGDREAVRRAASEAGLEELLAELPDGLDTPLGKLEERGSDLSGGQWQRIAMARSLVSPAPFRILDEPTAALDPISESRVYDQFAQMSAGVATLFISHRLGSTKLASHIFVLEDGRVAEEGSHAELMARGGLYAEMYHSQQSWYREEGRIDAENV